MHKWSYMIRDDQFAGPVSEAEFHAAIKSGNVQPTTKVHSDTGTNGKWVQANLIPSAKIVFGKLPAPVPQKYQSERSRTSDSDDSPTMTNPTMTKIVMKKTLRLIGLAVVTAVITVVVLIVFAVINETGTWPWVFWGLVCLFVLFVVWAIGDGEKEHRELEEKKQADWNRLSQANLDPTNTSNDPQTDEQK